MYHSAAQSTSPDTPSQPHHRMNLLPIALACNGGTCPSSGLLHSWIADRLKIFVFLTHLGLPISHQFLTFWVLQREHIVSKNFLNDRKWIAVSAVWPCCSLPASPASHSNWHSWELGSSSVASAFETLRHGEQECSAICRHGIGRQSLKMHSELWVRSSEPSWGCLALSSPER